MNDEKNSATGNNNGDRNTTTQLNGNTPFTNTRVSNGSELSYKLALNPYIMKSKDDGSLLHNPPNLPLEEPRLYTL